MPLPDPPVEVEFRDGPRSVPHHVQRMLLMAEIDPSEHTYEEAVELSNSALLRSRLNDTMWKIIHRHFADNA